MSEDVKEQWLNIYTEDVGAWTSGILYKTPKQARTNLCDREHYLHTINVFTGEIVNKKLPKR